jgi:hypothetical protein
MAAASSAGDSDRAKRALDLFRKLPLGFEANAGQSDAHVRFLSRQGEYTLFLTNDQAIIASTKLPAAGAVGGRGEKPRVFRMAWAGAARTVETEGLNPFPGVTNYLVGNGPGDWTTNVPIYGSVRYRGLYPGIDLVYYGNEGTLEFDLVVSPDARVESVALELDGPGGIHFDPSGDLILGSRGRGIRLRKPVAYQPGAAGRDYVEIRYKRKGRHTVGFEVARYDRSRPLIIDPLLTYSSYLGGSADDSGWKVAVDSSGFAYVVGHSSSAAFPMKSPFQGTNQGTTNAIVAKLNPEAAGAASLVYSTYLGGAGISAGRGIAVNGLGQIYIGGDTTSLNFPVTPGAYQSACKLASSVCSGDGFVAKLDATGSSLLYSTYIGGSGKELGYAMAIDNAGHIFLTGPTGSADFPVTAGAFQTTFAGGGTPFGDVFIAEINPAGNGASDLLYSTYLGGTGSDQAWAIAVDAQGAVYVTGATTSANFPLTAGAYQSTYAGAGDAFVSKLIPGGQGKNDLVYSTYLGGSSDDHGEGIALDSSNLVYVTGFTGGGGFPVTPATAFQPAYGGGAQDAFIVKLNPGASGAASLVYSTFFGGSGFDLGHGIALDSLGRVYVTGETDSLNFPLANPIQSQCAGGCTPSPLDDMFIAKFDLTQTGAAALLFSTYLGGSDVDTGWGIAADSNGNAYVTGQVFSLNLPTMLPYQSFCNGCTSFNAPQRSGDGFLVKVCTTACPAASLSTNSLAFGSVSIGSSSGAQSVSFTNTGSGDLTIGAITITGPNPRDFSQTNNCPSVVPAQISCSVQVTFTPAATGTRTASLTFTDNGGGGSQATGLSGTGVGTPSSVALSPASLTFPSQVQGTQSAALPITLTNNGPGVLTISGISLTGTNPGDFAQNNNCPISPAKLAVNGSCTINVTFTPAAVGARSASVTITDNGSASPQAIALSGTGAIPVVGLSASSLVFGNQTVKTTSAAQTVTVTNNGPGALTISGISLAGANPGDYAQNNNCPISPATLAVNGTCTINVTFTPTAVGVRSATVTIMDNGSGSSQTVGLSGTGTAPVWPNGYSYQATFIVAGGKVPSAQSNFPVLISGTYADFKTAGNGGKIVNICTQTVGNNTIPVPCDLIFTSDAGGSVRLNWEFESYNAATGAVIVWVRVPTLTSGTVVYAWYGNAAVSMLQATPAATWNSNFMAVYHLKENPAGTAPQMNDSTANFNHATTNGGMPAGSQVAGEIGGSLNFSGGSYYLTLANANNFSLEYTDSWSVSCWVKPASTPTAFYLGKQTNIAPVRGWGLRQDAASASNLKFGFSIANNGGSAQALGQTSASFPTGSWYHVVATYSGNGTVAGMNLYVNGAAQTVKAALDNLGATTIVNAAAPQISGRNGANYMSTAVQDECRVYARGVVLSPDWIATEYNNQSNPGAFFTVTTGLVN